MAGSVVRVLRRRPPAPGHRAAPEHRADLTLNPRPDEQEPKWKGRTDRQTSHALTAARLPAADNDHLSQLIGGSRLNESQWWVSSSSDRSASCNFRSESSASARATAPPHHQSVTQTYCRTACPVRIPRTPTTDVCPARLYIAARLLGSCRTALLVAEFHKAEESREVVRFRPSKDFDALQCISLMGGGNSSPRPPML